MDAWTLRLIGPALLLPANQTFEDVPEADSEHYLTSNRKRQKEKRTHASVPGFPT